MPQQLVADALLEAHTRQPSVRAPVFARAARVLAAFDVPAAQAQLERAVTLFESLPDDERTALGWQMLRLAGAVSPDAAWPLMRYAGPFGPDGVLYTMLDHGHVDAVMPYLKGFEGNTPFPYQAAGQALGPATDPETRRIILRHAIEAWRTGSSSSSPMDLPRFLQHRWQLLPNDEAVALLREMVERIEREDDGPMTGGFDDGEKRIAFTSIRAQRLFELLGTMRHLAPELAQELIDRYPKLAAHAQVFPNGMEREARPGPHPAPMSAEERAAWIREHDMIECNGGWLPIPGALQTEFRAAFDDAGRLYQKDAGGNLAPKELWPSAQAYRTILFKSGSYEARAAMRYLERVPDDDLRLFAQIELAAALAGRRQIGDSSTFWPRHAGWQVPFR